MVLVWAQTWPGRIQRPVLGVLGKEAGKPFWSWTGECFQGRS